MVDIYDRCCLRIGNISHKAVIQDNIIKTPCGILVPAQFPAQLYDDDEEGYKKPNCPLCLKEG